MINLIINLKCQEVNIFKLKILTHFSLMFFILIGGKRGHKGGRRHFTDPQALEAAKAKEEKEKEWRRARGEIIESDEEDKTDEDKSSSGDEDGVAFKDKSSSESESEDEDRKPKGAEES